MSFKFHYFKLIPFLSALASASAFAVETSPAVENLTRLLEKIQTIEADVKELAVKSSGGALEESDIKMYFDKPDGFYWQVLSPFEELTVTNGELLWIYDPDLEQVTVEKWHRDDTEVTQQLLSGDIDTLTRDYSIEVLSHVNEEDWEFKLTPVDPASLYRQLSLRFVEAKLQSIHVDYGTGEQFIWTFTALVLNQPIPAARFTFVVPEGIEVIEIIRTP